MRLLFIHEVNYEAKVIYEMHEFPELLALRGHDVTFFHYPEGSGRRSARTRRERIAGRAYSNARLELITPPTFGGAPAERVLAPLIDAPALRREIRHGGYDAIVLYAVPTTGWQTVAFARRAGVPVIFRALDVSHAIRETPFNALIRRAEKYVYRNADLISANNPAMADYCVTASARRGPVSVDLPPVDLEHFERAAKPVRSRYGLRDDDRVIAYMGSFFEFSGLDLVIPAIAPLMARDERLRLLLIGGGTLDQRLRDLAEHHGLSDRIIFTGVVPYAELPEHLRAADVAINPFLPLQVTHVAFPHKVLQYMAAGVPAVSTSLDGLRGVLGDDSGVTWADGPQTVIEAAVSLAEQDAELRASISARQRAFVDATFSLDLAVSGFERTIGSVG
ncbi:glycosyltransferase [Agromyces fucosus]|uniref:Glycosyltransferase n=2 Tax=Agromyces fucosus TaxID=41985 RepID=A0A4Q2JUK9_9MICO|nr:glycosyltransferase [Agromyces fucosus]